MKYYQQHSSQHRRQAKCTAVPIQIVELSHSYATWLLVDTKSEIHLLNHQNRIETTVSTHTRKRQHKRKPCLIGHCVNQWDLFLSVYKPAQYYLHFILTIYLEECQTKSFGMNLLLHARTNVCELLVYHLTQFFLRKLLGTRYGPLGTRFSPILGTWW